MALTKNLKKISNELWHGKVPNLSYLKVSGCKALLKRDTPDKLEPRSVKCIFVGYLKETMSYSFYYTSKNKMIVAWNAEVFKNSLISQEASRSYEDLEEIQDKDIHPSKNTSEHHDEVKQEIV
nr:retrovirus-related Pol polyprotein from transposon TNT 1-94 [Tanacetum cinerariifolium]